MNIPCNVDEWLNVQQSIQLPMALLPLLFFNSNKRIMGKFVLTLKYQIFYFFISFIIILVNFYLIFDAADSLKTQAWYKWFIFAIIMIIYIGFNLYLIYDFMKQNYWNNNNDHLLSRDNDSRDNDSYDACDEKGYNDRIN